MLGLLLLAVKTAAATWAADIDIDFSGRTRIFDAGGYWYPISFGPRGMLVV